MQPIIPNASLPTLSQIDFIPFPIVAAMPVRPSTIIDRPPDNALPTALIALPIALPILLKNTIFFLPFCFILSSNFQTSQSDGYL